MIAANKDEALLAALRTAVAQVDPVPPDVVAAAEATLTWLTVDAELAELAEDTALLPLAGVRGASAVDTDPRMLAFDASDTAIVIEVTEVGAKRRLLGQLVGEPEATIEVRHTSGESITVSSDDLGRFRADGVPAGAISLAITFARGHTRPLVTSWVSL